MSMLTKPAPQGLSLRALMTRGIGHTLCSGFFKVYGILVGMYACQVWSTEYLREGSEFKSQLQERHLCSLRCFLGVKSNATNWPVLRE
eukprot:833202-Pelagomonas_calceolata.AAC.1